MRKFCQSNSFVRFCLHILGVLLCVCPPAFCTLSYFPIWKENTEKTLAGGALILLILSVYPLIKLIKKHLASAASYTVWLIIFLAFLILSRIAHEMTVIAFYGFVGNLLGAVCFWISKRWRNNA